VRWLREVLRFLAEGFVYPLGPRRRYYEWFFSPRGLLWLALAVAALWLYSLVFGQTALTPEQVAVYERLVEESLKRDPGVLRALADLERARADAGFLGSLGGGVSVSLAGSYDQVSPGYRLSLSLDLAGLLRDPGPELAARERALEAARGEVRVRVLEAYLGYLYALEAARQASDGLEARMAELEAVRARARVGVATASDVLAAAERVSAARLALYRKNLDVALAFETLASRTGLEADALRAALWPGGDPARGQGPATGAEGGPAAPGAASGEGERR